MVRGFATWIVGVLTLISYSTVAQTACDPTHASLTFELEALSCDETDVIGTSEFYVIAGIGDNEHTSAVVEANAANVATFNVVWDMGCVEYSLSDFETPYFLYIAVWEDDFSTGLADDLGYRGYVRIPKTESGSVKQQTLRDPDTASQRTWMSFSWVWSQIPTKPPTKRPTKLPTKPPTKPPTLPPPPPTAPPPTQTPSRSPSKMSPLTTLPPTSTPTKARQIRHEFDNVINFTDDFTFFWSSSSSSSSDDDGDAILSMALVCSGCDGFMGIATNDDQAYQYASAIIGVCGESVISVAQYSLRSSRIVSDLSLVQPLTATSCSIVGNVTTLRFSRNVTSTDFNLDAGYIFWVLGRAERITMQGTKVAGMQAPTQAPTTSPSHPRPPGPTNYPSRAPTFIGHTSASPTVTLSIDVQTTSTLATTTTAQATTANIVPTTIAIATPSSASAVSPSIVTTNQACANDVDAITQCVQLIYVFDQSCDVLALQCARTCCRKAIDTPTTTTTTTAAGTPRTFEATNTMGSAGITTTSSSSTPTPMSPSTISPQASNEPNSQSQQQAHTITIVGGAVAAVIIIIVVVVVVVMCVIARKRRNTSSQTQSQSHTPVYKQHTFKNPMFVSKSQSTATTPDNGVNTNESAYEQPVLLNSNYMSAQDASTSQELASAYELPIDESELHYDEFTKYRENENNDQAYGSLVGAHAVYGQTNNNNKDHSKNNNEDDNDDDNNNDNDNDNDNDGQSYYASIANDDSAVYATGSSSDRHDTHVDGYLDVGGSNANSKRGGKRLADDYRDGIDSFS